MDFGGLPVVSKVSMNFVTICISFIFSLADMSFNFVQRYKTFNIIAIKLNKISRFDLNLKNKT